MSQYSINTIAHRRFARRALYIVEWQPNNMRKLLTVPSWHRGAIVIDISKHQFSYRVLHSRRHRNRIRRRWVHTFQSRMHMRIWLAQVSPKLQLRHRVRMH